MKVEDIFKLLMDVPTLTPMDALTVTAVTKKSRVIMVAATTITTCENGD